MRSTLIAALILLTAAALPADAHARGLRLRADFGLAGGSTAAGPCCAFGAAAATASIGLGAGRWTLDYRSTSALLGRGFQRPFATSHGSVIAGVMLANRLELGLGATHGTLHLRADDSRHVFGPHARIALHTKSRKGFVLSLDAIPVLGREVALATVLLGVGWGWR